MPSPRNHHESASKEKFSEPWVDLPDGQAFSSWTRDDEISFNQRNRQVEKHRFFVNIYDFIKDNRVIGDYYEFGSHRVRTFRMSLSEAKRHLLDNMRFY